MTRWLGMAIANNPRKESLHKPEKNLSRELSLESKIPTPGPASQENHHSKRQVHPIITAALLTVFTTQSQENVYRQNKASRKCGTYTQCLLLSHEKPPQKL